MLLTFLFDHFPRIVSTLFDNRIKELKIPTYAIEHDDFLFTRWICLSVPFLCRTIHSFVIILSDQCYPYVLLFSFFSFKKVFHLNNFVDLLFVNRLSQHFNLLHTRLCFCWETSKCWPIRSSRWILHWSWIGEFTDWIGTLKWRRFKIT